MEQYISKSALVAEINQRIEEYKSHKIDDSYHDGLIFALEDLRDDFINTLEVKEVQEVPVSEDLEEAALMHFKDVMEYKAKTGLKMANITSFKAGAKWQEEKDDEEKVLTYKHGFEDCKEMMMAKAIDAKLLEGHLIRQKGVTHPLHVGDEVKVIVIKED